MFCSVSLSTIAQERWVVLSNLISWPDIDIWFRSSQENEREGGDGGGPGRVLVCPYCPRMSL